MSDTSETARLALPLIEASQAQKHITHNEALLLLDAMLQLSVISRTQHAPPATPQPGDRYLVAANATAEWSNHAGDVAYFEAQAWHFAEVRKGWRLWVEEENLFLIYDGAVWRALASPGTDALTMLGVNTTADTYNRLAVSSPAILFNHAGNGHQVKINKNAASDTASLLFQTGYSGRAEFGLAGDDQFRIKVSADGGTWAEALRINSTSGLVTLAGNSISNAALADMPAATLKGRSASGTGDPEDLTPQQVISLLPIFTASQNGLAPASAGGTSTFLRADGQWATPALPPATQTIQSINLWGRILAAPRIMP